MLFQMLGTHACCLGTPSEAVKDYCKRNWMVTAKCIETGLPSSDAGWYFHCFKASMAACCSNVGPETTFMEVTRPLASINASTRTLPETRWVLASAGYAGATEEISFACFTSPPTESGAVGAEGFSLLPTSPALSASAPESDSSSLLKAMPASGSPALCARRLGVTLGLAK